MTSERLNLLLLDPLRFGCPRMIRSYVRHFYGTNPPLYPQWQEYFRKHQPPMLIVWGKNDQIFPAVGAEPYKRDIKSLEFHLLDAGHFALESKGDEIATLIRGFLTRVHQTKN